MGSENVEQLITDHIDLWISAIENKRSSGRGSSKKQSLYGIKKLRELILELAVRGKLVPQNPNDESAIVVLDAISDERASLIKEKKIRKAKLANVQDLPEVVVDLPKGWSLPSVNDLLVNGSDDIVDGPFGSKLKATEYVDTGVPIIRIQNIDRALFKREGIQYVTEEKGKELERHNYIAGDLVLNKLGEPTGKVCIVPENFESGIIVADIVRIRLDAKIHNTEYLMLAMNSPLVANQFAALSKGVTRQRVNLSQVRSFKVPLPPKEEQSRIVKRIKALFNFCDQLEEQTENYIDAHQRLVETLLDTLTQSQNADELAENWERVAEHFDTLFTTEHSIEQLKQTVLQLAVMGKLVPQDPDEEPASILLERISSKKVQLIKDKKIKKQKTVPPFAPNELVSCLPQGWVQVRFGDVTFNRDAERIPLSVNDRRTRQGEFDYYGASGVIDSIDGYLFEDPLLLIGEDGANLVNRSTPIAFLARGKYWVNNHAHVIDGISEGFLEYLAIHINAISLLPYITGTAQPKMNQAKMNLISINLPPLAEQTRIVDKVHQLFALCEGLKKSLGLSQAFRIKVTDSLVNPLM